MSWLVIPCLLYEFERDSDKGMNPFAAVSSCEVCLARAPSGGRLVVDVEDQRDAASRRKRPLGI